MANASFVQASLQCRPKVERVDPVPFVVGVLTLLTQVQQYDVCKPHNNLTDNFGCWQFHSNYVARFIQLMGEYIRFAYAMPPNNKQTMSLPSATNVLLFLEELCRMGNISRKMVEEHVPQYVFDSFRHEAS